MQSSMRIIFTLRHYRTVEGGNALPRKLRKKGTPIVKVSRGSVFVPLHRLPERRSESCLIGLEAIAALTTNRLQTDYARVMAH